MKCMLVIVVNLVLSSVALAGPERIVHVASTGPGDGDFVGVVLGPGDGAAVNNYECVTNDSGCPANTKLIDGSGNFIGCTAGCTGNCTACSGNLEISPTLCKYNPTYTCTLTLPLIRCGLQGTGACGTIGPGSPDNNGCYCTPPATYPPSGTSCSFKSCF
ncbi:MAG: hypothetical protein ACKVW3_02045 [Phycisphaerales bacterium]